MTVDIFVNNVEFTGRRMTRGVNGPDYIECEAYHVFAPCRVMWTESGHGPISDETRESAIAALKILAAQYGY